MFIAVLWLSGCERDPRVVIEYGVPLRFTVSGPGKIKYFRVNGPDLERDAANRQGTANQLPKIKLYWKIAPAGSAADQSLDKVGTIIYGQVPTGMVQVYPEHGSPPPLVDGDVYNVHLEPVDSYTFQTFFSIKNGKIFAVGQD